MELVILLPALMVLTLGCVDFGRAIHSYIIVSNAARVGAEYGAVHRFTDDTRPHWESQLRQVTFDELAALPAHSTSNAQVTIETFDESDGTLRIAVSARADHSMLCSWPGLPAVSALSHRVCMRQVR